jgi:hypothetical protein
MTWKAVISRWINHQSNGQVLVHYFVNFMVHLNTRSGPVKVNTVRDLIASMHYICRKFSSTYLFYWVGVVLKA